MRGRHREAGVGEWAAWRGVAWEGGGARTERKQKIERKKKSPVNEWNGSSHCASKGVSTLSESETFLPSLPTFNIKSSFTRTVNVTGFC